MLIPAALLCSIAIALTYLFLTFRPEPSVPLGAAATIPGGMASISGIVPLENDDWEPAEDDDVFSRNQSTRGKPPGTDRSECHLVGSGPNATERRRFHGARNRLSRGYVRCGVHRWPQNCGKGNRWPQTWFSKSRTRRSPSSLKGQDKHGCPWALPITTASSVRWAVPGGSASAVPKVFPSSVRQSFSKKRRRHRES